MYNPSGIPMTLQNIHLICIHKREKVLGVATGISIDELIIYDPDYLDSGARRRLLILI